MKLPILYALAYPHLIQTNWPRFDFASYAAFTFEPPDLEAFQNLALALDAMKRGGNAPCVLNAANEGRDLFLQDLDQLPRHERPDRALSGQVDLCSTSHLGGPDGLRHRNPPNRPRTGARMEFPIKAAQLILSLSILVVLHELGHFIPARWFKTRVEKFYLFFDPWFSLFKRRSATPSTHRLARSVAM